MHPDLNTLREATQKRGCLFRVLQVFVFAGATTLCSVLGLVAGTMAGGRGGVEGGGLTGLIFGVIIGIVAARLIG